MDVPACRRVLHALLSEDVRLLSHWCVDLIAWRTSQILSQKLAHHKLRSNELHVFARSVRSNTLLQSLSHPQLHQPRCVQETCSHAVYFCTSTFGQKFFSANITCLNATSASCHSHPSSSN